MEGDYWLQRWQKNQIGFHLDEPIPWLMKYWPQLNISKQGRVLVPLCGKSLDMLWLRDQGYDVLGVELSDIAIQQFLQENDLRADTHETSMGVHYTMPGIEIIQGDVFALSEAIYASCGSIYDRASIIAFPEAMRKRFATEVYGRMPKGSQAFMITLDYPEAEKQGPPFSVRYEELQQLLQHNWQVTQLDRRNILADSSGFKEQGLSEIHTGMYHLLKLS